MIEPFFFGSKPLFGVYHPCSNAQSQQLVVICPPLFDEYSRSYRALSDFAAACTESGFHVLRFDYSGTGDSGEDLLSINSVEHWQDDIASAIEEGCALSGADAVTLVGVRFGATLALGCRHADIVSRVLWDPIPSGSEALRWLAGVDQWQVEYHCELAKVVGLPLPLKSDASQQFVISDALRASIANLSYASLPHNTKLVFGSEANASAFNTRVANASAGGDFEQTVLSEVFHWPAFEGGLIRPIEAFSCMLELMAPGKASQQISL